MTKIEWTDETYNPVWGCKLKCNYCYAMKQAARFASEIAHKEYEYRKKNYPDKLIPFEELVQKIKKFEPVYLYSQIKKKFSKKTKRVFIGSMSDIAFWERDWIYDLLIKIYLYPEINFQILSKKPGKIAHIDFPENVWLGISASNQKEYEKRVSKLLTIKAGKHFISLEPLFEPVNIRYYINAIGKVKLMNERKRDNGYISKLDWVIVGGQTGQGAQAMHPDWVKRIQADCEYDQIPFFFKSWGHWSPEAKSTDFKYVDFNGNMRYKSEKESAVRMYNVSKKVAGRLLNSKEYNEFPK